MAYEVSVFLENKIGHFESITGVLREADINIRSLNLNNISHGWGVLNLLVDQPEKAYKLLSSKGNSVALREVIALEMKNEAGGLDELLLKLAKSGIHFINAYSRLLSDKRIAILLLEVPDVIEATERLVKNNITILEDAVVYGN
ncbi:MAG: hypothetical protein JXR31_12380 [Prolixibacteraceae bacterium]|nr:hypothetical protein [Prolixibacteraceae bacterium]MBN2775043.1 hypothetical protein [Prolixibacteraceae bacterium]